MALFKNVTGQKIAVYAHDTSADAPKTGDAANITAQISLDFGAAAATNDTNPTELDATDHPGIYVFTLTQAETNAEAIVISAVSATADISIEPVQVFTTPVYNDISTSEVNTEMSSVLGAAELATESQAAAILMDTTAIKTKTDNLPASPAAVGSEMTLADDAITASKFDESSAFPLASADSGATAVARVGADSDTLETLSDQIDGINGGSTVNVTTEATNIISEND